MNERGANEVEKIRRDRKKLTLWLFLGPTLYATLIVQAFNLPKSEAAVPWLAARPVFWVSIFLVWGLIGYVLQRVIANRKPDWRDADLRCNRTINGHTDVKAAFRCLYSQGV